eukprot:11341133-Alexandrium_andersonii.AAC.1
MGRLSANCSESRVNAEPRAGREGTEKQSGSMVTKVGASAGESQGLGVRHGEHWPDDDKVAHGTPSESSGSR